MLAQFLQHKPLPIHAVLMHTWYATKDFIRNLPHPYKRCGACARRSSSFTASATTSIEKNLCRKVRIQPNHSVCAMLVWLRLTELARQTRNTVYRIKQGLLGNCPSQPSTAPPPSKCVLRQS